MSDSKALLLRVFGDLARSKAPYSRLGSQTDDPALRTWLMQVEQRLGDDLHWVQHVLRHKFGVHT